ncbi:MAG: glycosyltransferase, partial [Bacteroidota bacterium]
NIKFIAIRNIPDKNKFTGIKKERIELNLSKEKKIIILQGSGINIDRGAEELVMSMKYLSENYLLLIIGGGDVINELKKISQIEKLNSKVIFIPRLKPEELFHYTINSDLGITIDKDTNLNYRFSLPNKIFDYLNAGIPVLASKLPEVEKLINKYEVGFFINNHSPEHIAEMIESSLESDKYNSTRKNTYKASIENSWEIEKKQWDLIL